MYDRCCDLLAEIRDSAARDLRAPFQVAGGYVADVDPVGLARCGREARLVVQLDFHCAADARPDCYAAARYAAAMLARRLLKGLRLQPGDSVVGVYGDVAALECAIPMRGA